MRARSCTCAPIASALPSSPVARRCGCQAQPRRSPIRCRRGTTARAKTAIVDFVDRVTTGGRPGLRTRPPNASPPSTTTARCGPSSRSISSLPFAVDRIVAMAPEHPEWNEKQPFKAIIDGDLKAALASGEKGLLEIVAATHAGMTDRDVRCDSSPSGSPSRGIRRCSRPYTDLVVPADARASRLSARERLQDASSSRAVASSSCGALPRRSTAFRPSRWSARPASSSSNSGRTASRTLIKEAKLEFVDDGPGKPVGINRFIGRRPIFAFGNSDGDQQMLQYTAAGHGARFMGLVHHTDADREWAYDRASHIGKLDKALDEAAAKGWTVVDMKTDWNTVFPPNN